MKMSSYETIIFWYVMCVGYLGTTITNQNLIQEEIKRRLNSRMLATIQS
jgi:hypothetical protein